MDWIGIQLRFAMRCGWDVLLFVIQHGLNFKRAVLIRKPGVLRVFLFFCAGVRHSSS